MSSRRRRLSESSDPDDPQPVAGGGLGFTATKRARLSQEEEDEGELGSQAGRLEKALDSSSSDTEPAQVEAARLDKPGQYSSAAERMMAKVSMRFLNDFFPKYFVARWATSPGAAWGRLDKVGWSRWDLAGREAGGAWG